MTVYVILILKDSICDFDTEGQYMWFWYWRTIYVIYGMTPFVIYWGTVFMMNLGTMLWWL